MRFSLDKYFKEKLWKWEIVLIFSWCKQASSTWTQTYFFTLFKLTYILDKTAQIISTTLLLFQVM